MHITRVAVECVRSLLGRVPEHVSFVTVVEVDITIVDVHTTSGVWTLLVELLLYTLVNVTDGSTLMFFTAPHTTVLQLICQLRWFHRLPAPSFSSRIARKRPLRHFVGRCGAQLLQHSLRLLHLT